MDTLRSEAAAGRQEAGGDLTGARLTRLQTQLKREREQADRRSPEAGNAVREVATKLTDFAGVPAR